MYSPHILEYKRTIAIRCSIPSDSIYRRFLCFAMTSAIAPKTIYSIYPPPKLVSIISIFARIICIQRLKSSLDNSNVFYFLIEKLFCTLITSIKADFLIFLGGCKKKLLLTNCNMMHFFASTAPTQDKRRTLPSK